VKSFPRVSSIPEASVKYSNPLSKNSRFANYDAVQKLENMIFEIKTFYKNGAQ
jgi:hypothetical protein